MTTRARLLLATGLVAAVLAAACGVDEPPAEGAAGAGASGEATAPAGDGAPAEQLPVTVTSADGRSVTVTDTSRIVPLQGSISEVVFALGLGDRVVARDISATFEEAEDLPLVTRAHDVSAESVLSLRPTLVLADTETGPPEALEHIRNVGVPVVVLERPTEVDAVGRHIEAVAAALGVPDAGRDLAERTDAEIASVTADPSIDPGIDPSTETDDRPVVAFLYLRGQAGVYLMGGPGSGSDSMIEAAGGRDAGTEIGLHRAFTPLTSEALVRAAPDVLLMTTTGLESVGGVDGLATVSGVAQTPAGAAGRIATVEDGLLFGFGPRTPEALRDLAAQLHATPAVAP